MKLQLSFVYLLFATLPVLAQVDPVDKKGVAIGGYDPVAYFTTNKPVKGSETITTTMGNVTYYFSSAENKRLFDANPIKYTPQFEGYCALAVSYGKKISVDPTTFKVTDNKLYLFYNGKSSKGKVNSLETWNKSEERLLKNANANWAEVKKLKFIPEETL